MKGFGEIYKSQKKNKNKSKLSKNQIINQAFHFHQQGNISEAGKYYKLFIDRGFSDERVFSNYGTILKDLGKLKEAELSTRKAIEINPDFADAHSNLGNIFRDLGKLQDAEKSYRKAIQLNPNHPLAYANLGSILIDAGKLQDAELSTRKAIENNANYANAHYNLGIILHNFGKLEDAEKSYCKAIQLNPGFAEAHYNLGIILKDLGKLHDAELSTRKAIQLNPGFAEAHSNLGTILRDLGKLHDAELSTRKAIQLNPGFAKSYSNLGTILRDLGKLQDAELSIRKAIQLNPDLAEAHCNLGIILMDLGKLQDAELSTRKAIQLNPDLAEAHCNLGNLLRDFGKLQDAELSICKAIQLNPDLAKAYYSLSLLKNSNATEQWIDQLFSKKILINKSQEDKIDIYFARANILHKEKKFEDSSRCLKIANNLELNLNPSNSDIVINKSRILLLESDKKKIYKKEYQSSYESIFIVGMFRSGSTLLESILSMRDDLYDLGENNILEKSFLEYKQSQEETNLGEIYDKKVNNETKFYTTTNKYLYNYQYAGIIAQHIPNAKIVHCYRNPLDNILSIYRAHFTKRNEYSSSLVDCAKVYLDQEEVMRKYKDRFRSKIYDLNYDSLVSNPKREIKLLIDWLGWKWDNVYLSPHLNQRSVSTASSIQVRSPINSKSINGWKNYKKILKPAIEIITQIDKYRELIL